MRTVYFIGMGPGDPGLVTERAIKTLSESNVIIGLARAVMTASASLDGRTSEHDRLHTLKIYEKFNPEEIIRFISQHPDFTEISIVFNGDTSIYSGAVPLKKALEEYLLFHPEEGEFRIINVPGVSTIQYFLSKSWISLADVRLLSLHRGIRPVVPMIRENRYTCVLLDGPSSLAEIAESLVRYGLTRVMITVGERLSFEEESFTTGTAREMRGRSFDEKAIALFRNDDFIIPKRSYGIADEHFQKANGFRLTARDIRALSICRLALNENSCVYDFGAGSGSMAVEIALACPMGQIIAVEEDEDAVMAIERNRYDFKVDNIRILKHPLPDCLKTETPDFGPLPLPDRVFINGIRGHIAEIVDWTFRKNPMAVVVINTESLENTAELLTLEAKMNDYEFEMVELHSTGLERRGSYHLHTSENPVTITRIAKRH